MAKQKTPITVRFWAKVQKGDGCWEWQASLDRDGYGHIGTSERPHTMLKAHRFSWELHHGPIPDGLFVCHRCDNPRCVRPDHLFLGTARDNVHDMTRKRRNLFQRRNPTLKLSEDQVRSIRQRRASGDLLRLIAADYGVTEGTVSRIVARVRRSEVA